MLTLWYLLLVHMAVYQSLTQGDASESFRLCVNDSVLVKPNSSGTIEYKHSDGENVGSCSLMLRGFETGSHISLPGVDAAGCLPNQTNVTINNESYCVKEGLSDNTLIIRITHTLSIKLPSPGPAGFSFEFYNNVVTCGQKVAVSDALETNQLSGIFARSYDPNTLSLGDCQIKFKKNRAELFVMLFKILHAVDAQTEVVGKLVYPVLPNIRKGQRHTESSSNGEIALIYRGHAGLSEYSVLVKYSVLYCNTKSLQLANATITPAHEIMLAGSMSTFTYSCMEGLMLNGTRELNVECMADEQGKTTLHQQNSLTRECVPVVCDPPLNFIFVTNGNISTTQDTYSYKEELKYECDDGYSKNGSLVCGDEGVWTGKPGCVMVCVLLPDSTFIANGNISTIQDTYSYKEELKYECDDGYSKNESVVCGDEGVWIGTPGCVQSTTDEDNAVVQTNGMRFNKELAMLLILSIGGLVVLVVIVVVVVHFCLRKKKKPNAESTTALDTSGRGEIQTGRNNSAGAYQEVSFSLERSKVQPRPPVITNDLLARTI